MLFIFKLESFFFLLLRTLVRCRVYFNVMGCSGPSIFCKPEMAQSYESTASCSLPLFHRVAAGRKEIHNGLHCLHFAVRYIRVECFPLCRIVLVCIKLQRDGVELEVFEDGSVDIICYSIRGYSV